MEKHDINTIEEDEKRHYRLKGTVLSGTEGSTT